MLYDCSVDCNDQFSVMTTSLILCLVEVTITSSVISGEHMPGDTLHHSPGTNYNRSVTHWHEKSYGCDSSSSHPITYHFSVAQTCGVKRGGGAMEHEATANKQPFLAPSAAGSGSSLKPSSADVWAQGENQTHIHSSG